MNFYYCIFSVACLEEEKNAKNGQKLPKKKINLRKDGNRRKMEDFHLFLFEGFPYLVALDSLDTNFYNSISEPQDLILLEPKELRTSYCTFGPLLSFFIW